MTQMIACHDVKSKVRGLFDLGSRLNDCHGDLVCNALIVRIEKWLCGWQF